MVQSGVLADKIEAKFTQFRQNLRQFLSKFALNFAQILRKFCFKLASFFLGAKLQKQLKIAPFDNIF